LRGAQLNKSTRHNFTFKPHLWETPGDLRRSVSAKCVATFQEARIEVYNINKKRITVQMFQLVCAVNTVKI